MDPVCYRMVRDRAARPKLPSSLCAVSWQGLGSKGETWSSHEGGPLL